MISRGISKVIYFMSATLDYNMYGMKHSLGNHLEVRSKPKIQNKPLVFVFHYSKYILGSKQRSET
jgi:hypothetical protein